MRKKSSLYQVGTRPLVGKAVYQNGCGPAPCQPQQQQPMQVSPPCMVPPPPPHQAYCTNTNFQASNIPQTRPSAATLPSYIRAAAAAAAVADSDDDDGSSGDGGGGSSSGGGSPTADRMPQLEEESSQFLPRLSPGDPGSLLPPYASSSPSSSSPRPHSKRSLRGPSEDCANSDKVPALPLAQALLGVPWVRGGEDIAYYPSPYRGRAAYPGATIPEIPTPPHHMSHHSLPSALPAGNAARKKVGKVGKGSLLGINFLHSSSASKLVILLGDLCSCLRSIKVISAVWTQPGMTPRWNSLMVEFTRVLWTMIVH